MNQEKLDNPVWYALNGPQRGLAIRGALCARFEPDIFMGAGMPEYTPAAFAELAGLAHSGEVIGVGAEAMPEELLGWRLVQRMPLTQMICETLDAPPPVPVQQLSSDDVEDMLSLIELTEPGPFLPRTIEMGHYLGIRVDGRLVAMAGERLHLAGYCEISAVCTHPEFRGRGYAAGLTAAVAAGIMARDETPFLTLLPDIHKAYALYRRLGFETRREVMAAFLLRTNKWPH